MFKVLKGRLTKRYCRNSDYAESTLLRYIGTVGAGKSVLLANMVDDIFTYQTHAIVTYFFCKHDIQSSLQADTIIQSLIRQILGQQLKQDWTPNDLGLGSDLLSRPYLDLDSVGLLKSIGVLCKGEEDFCCP